MINLDLDHKTKPLAILFSDLHIGPGIFRGASGDEDMLSRTQQVLVDLWEAAANNDITTIICAGDLFDQAFTISIKALDTTVALLKKLQHDYPVRFLCITGNHDLGTRNIANTSIEHSSINVLAHAGLLEIVDGRSLKLGNSIFSFIPYMLQPASAIAEALEALEVLLNIDDKLRGYLVMHQTPSINSLGLPADFDGENIANNRISYISGHIHKPAIGLKGRILGCPLHLSADDLGQQKFVYVLLDNGAIKAVPTTYTQVRPHIVQELQAINVSDNDTEAASSVYATAVAWDTLVAYAKNDPMLLVYIQQFIA